MRPTEQSLAEAFKLIREFKEGLHTPGTKMSKRQVSLLKLLRRDLLPDEPSLDQDFEALVLRTAAEDAKWNHSTMKAIDQIYTAMTSGKNREVAEIQKEFLCRCPSRWYRQIVESA